MSTALFTVVKFEICKAIGKCNISGYLGDLRSTSRETHPTHRNKTNDLILNLTPENVTQHSRIVTTTRKGSSTPTKMSKIIGRQFDAQNKQETYASKCEKVIHMNTDFLVYRIQRLSLLSAQTSDLHFCRFALAELIKLANRWYA